MKKLKNNESGFSAVELMLIIVVIGLLGTTGYLFYKNRQKPATVTVTKTVTAPVTSSTPTTTTTPVDEKPAITQAVKDYKDNVKYASITKVSITAVDGANAYGTVTYTGQDGGGGWLAHKTGTTWAVVSQGSLGICKDEVQQYNLPASWESTAC